MRGEQEDEPTQYMSNSVYETARSAIVYLHKEAGIEMSSELRQRLCDFMSGMRRKVSSQRKENRVSIMEGKRIFEYSGENIGTRGRQKQFMWETVLNHYLRKGQRFTNELE